MPAELPLTTRLAVLTSCLVLWVGQYFAINRLGAGNRPRKDWSNQIDAAIPFVPGFAVPYLSTYLFGLLPFILIEETRLFVAAAYGYLAITAISAVIHLLWPSQVRRVEAPADGGLSARLLSDYQRMCRPYDNFPSRHVAYSVVVTGMAFQAWGPAWGIVFAVWAALIAISTLLTKQHYLADLAAGGLLGMVVLALFTAWA
jgi:membrane-associated phospholipid phosphatase